MRYYDTAGEKPETLCPFLDLRKSVREAPSDSYRWCYPLVSSVVAGYIPVRQLVWRWQLYLHQEYENTALLPYQPLRVLNRPERLLYHRPTI